MEKPFEEKLHSSYQRTVERHPFLRIPASLLCGLIVFVYTWTLRFIGGWRKYAISSFLLVNILVGSSFAYPAFVVESKPEPSETAQSEAGFPLADAQDESEYRLIGDDLADEIFDEIDSESEISSQNLDEFDGYSLADILEEREENAIHEGIDLTADGGNGEELRFSADDWRLVLINKQHPIPDDYEYVLGTIKGRMQADERIIDDLLLMMQHALDDGIELVIISTYRDMAHQEMLFNRKLDAYMRKGLSYFEAYKRTSVTVTVPGSSEHEVGLAIDIASQDFKSLTAAFADTAAGEWLSEHCYDYGFILRYQRGKEYITGIEFEPWHFRYVGRDAAYVMKNEGLALEEFVEKYVMPVSGR